MNFRALVRGCASVALVCTRLGAQAEHEPVASPADLAISRGRLDEAEQALYAASSRAAHEPSARGALGMFLASRGHLKVGAVLLEEARQFGGDASTIDARLARIYSWIGDWSAVAALKHASASGPEHDRAAWLAVHTPARTGPDSLSVALEPNELAGLGRVELVVGNERMQADVNPNVDGLVLPSTLAMSAASQQFGMRDSGSVAVVYEASIGAMRLTNVPARMYPGVRPMIGLDLLAALTPTFDVGAHRLTLRQVAASPSGDPLPILLSFPGVRLVTREGQAPVAIDSAAGRAALRGTRWTLNVRQGAIVLLP
jgi:hypothetical protein